MRVTRYIVIAAVVLVCCSLYAAEPGTIIVATQTGRAQSQPSGAPPPSSDKPAEQVRKNIQVLQGLPDSQLIPVMHLMNASLGVECAHCHVREGNNWAFDKDDKKEKQVTRQMIRMTREINRSTFNGKTEVSCFTCHQGGTHPVSAVPLPFEPRSVSAAASTRGTEALPSTAEILKKFQDAAGSKAALLKAGPRSCRGTMLDPQGNSFPVEVNQKPPDKLLISVTLRQGTMVRAVDGARGWVKTAQGVRDAQPVEIAQLQRLADFYWAAKLLEKTADLSVVRKEKVGDREAYVLRMPIDPARFELLYFDADNGLLLRRRSRADTVIGPWIEQIDFGDYRDVNGIKLPFEIKANGPEPRGDFTLKYSEVISNVPIEDSRFAKP